MLGLVSKFHFFTGLSSILCVYTSPFVYPFIGQWILGHFSILAIVNSTTVNTGTCTSARFLLLLPLNKSSEVELLSHVVILFNFVRKYHPVFHRSCTILYPHQECITHTYQYWFYVWECFSNSHPSGCGVVSHCGSDLRFPNNL